MQGFEMSEPAVSQNIWFTHGRVLKVIKSSPRGLKYYFARAPKYHWADLFSGKIGNILKSISDMPWHLLWQLDNDVFLGR